MKKIYYFQPLLLLFVSQIEIVAQPFPIPASANHSGGEFQIYRSRANNNLTLQNLRKPLLWIEGFDPLNETDIEDNYRLINRNTLALDLHDLGYDIIVLNFNDGGDNIRRNARLLTELISLVNSNKPTNDELVVMGFSMGGLVARYALTSMEENGIDHETRLYVSYDSPHQGAHVPVSIQALALTFNRPVYLNLFPDIADQIIRFEAPAALEMLKYRISSGTQATGQVNISQSHINFMNEINSLNDCNGFPKNTRNIGISLGSWSGIPQRANFDSDNDGQNDFQFPGFPSTFINFPESEHDGTVSIWNINTCQAVAAFTLQSFLSNAVSYNYPYANERSNYLGLNDFFYATYWYRNSNNLAVLPQGAWSRAYSYENFEDTDFAPGSFADGNQQLVDALNSQINCSFAYYSNSTFIPTVSALAFDTHDLFYNIRDDADRLKKTPFDEIFGMDRENESHVADQATHLNLTNWLVNQINRNPSNFCLEGLTQVGNFEGSTRIEVVNSGETVAINSAENIESQNYHINSGASVTFSASNSIMLNDGFHAKGGSEFVATIAPCPEKSCFWTPFYTNSTQPLQFEIEILEQPTCSDPCVPVVARVIGRNGNFSYQWSRTDGRIPCDPPISCNRTFDLGTGKYLQNFCFNTDGLNETRSLKAVVTEFYPDGSSSIVGEVVVDGAMNCMLIENMSQSIDMPQSAKSEDSKQRQAFVVYPNPSEGLFNLHTSEKVNQIVVRDSYHKPLKILQVSGDIHTIDLRNYKDGIYFLEVHFENENNQSLRIIKE